MRYHGGSGRPAEVIALRCSLGSRSVHQCMYGCVRAAHKAPKDVGVVRGGADGGKIGKMAGGRARTARGRKRPRELRRHRRELHHTYERRPRARRRRARRRGAGAGSRRARSLLRRSSQVLLCRGRCIECLLIKIGNDTQMAMPMPGARVRAAGAGATPCSRKKSAALLNLYATSTVRLVDSSRLTTARGGTTEPRTTNNHMPATCHV